MKSLTAVWSFLAVLAISGIATAAPTDDIADALVQAAHKTITADSLSTDFTRLSKFVRHEANGMILFTDGGPTDGYVRHAQAQFDISAKPHSGATMPLFSVAFELVDQQGFTFDGLAAALEQRLGTPSVSSNQAGAIFRTWLLKEPAGRSVTIAQAQASDNGDRITVVDMIQKR